MLAYLQNKNLSYEDENKYISLYFFIQNPTTQQSSKLSLTFQLLHVTEI